MIKSFGNKLTEDLWHEIRSRHIRHFEPSLLRIALRKLTWLDHARMLEELTMPPGNRLEKLSGNYAGYWSIRINEQWRIVFRWEEQNAWDVAIVDYH